jgi:hypothetical protein
MIAGLKCWISFTVKSLARLPSTESRVMEQLLTVVRHQRQRFSGRYQESAVTCPLKTNHHLTALITTLGGVIKGSIQRLLPV